MDFRGFGGRSPAKLTKILKKIGRKINGNRQNVEDFHEFLANFDLKKLILIKIKASLVELWTSVIILKEIKKPSGKFLRVWAKNQLRFEILEKILKFTYKNLNGKLIFYPFSLLSSRTFVILYTSGTYKNFWGWFGGSSAGFGGTFDFGAGWGLYKSLRCTHQQWELILLIFHPKRVHLHVHTGRTHPHQHHAFIACTNSSCPHTQLHS